MTMFRIGQRVVCVDASGNPETQHFMPMWVRQGEVYTVRGIRTEDHIEGYGLLLEECLNPVQPWADGTESEWAFKSARFRPLVESLDRANKGQLEKVG